MTISGNHISGDAYTGDPNNGTGAGVLLFSTKNDLVTGNVITSSNNGVAIAGGDFSLCSPGDSTGHVVTCNSIRDNAINNTVGGPAAGPGVISDAANNTINMNVIRNNELGADGTAISSGLLNAEDNWWGCVGGPGTFGCDTVAGNVDFTPFLTEPPACVPDTEELNVTKLRFMRSTLPSGDNSNIFGKGDFIAGTPTEVTGSGGVTIRIQDSFGTDKTHTFATCTTTPVRVRCVETNHSIMDIKAFGNPLTHRIKFKVKQLGLTGPFNGPATVTLSYSTLERVGVISDCQVRASGLLCRQF